MVKQFDGGLFAGDPCEVVLGIDQSYSGFSVTALARDGEPRYHSWVFKSEGQGVLRLNGIRDFVFGLIEKLDSQAYFIADCAMEGYAYSAQMGHMAGELGGMVKLILLDRLDMKPLIVPPSTLKKYVTGKGTKVQKNQMLLFIFKKWGVELLDDNAADSYALARVVSGRADTAYEREVLDKLKEDKFRDP